MVDITDLKSVGPKALAGSSPAAGTTCSSFANLTKNSLSELVKKTARIFSLLFLLFLAVSCDQGCIEADEFDAESVVIESNPVNDGIEGTYDNSSGGERANWHDTKLRANGDQFLIQISGAWTPWNGNDTHFSALSVTDAKLAELPRCFFCAKRLSSTNCICYSDNTAPNIAGSATPLREASITGNEDKCVTSVVGSESSECLRIPPEDADCSGADKNDPEKCTCAPGATGAAEAYGVYHFPRNFFDKSEARKTADRQIPCKYDRGMGAYIALFGRSGTEVPSRAYHLFSESKICSVIRDSQGRCLDSNGNDMTRYIFRSANQRIFMKDDKRGNDGSDANTSDDEYHSPNEIVKVIILDSFYSDNFGKYNISILRGVGPKGNSVDNGLLEFLVGMVEDVLLGKADDSGNRQGGILKFMYQAIVQDSGFALALQVTLALYITLFGGAHLFGIVEMNKKELMSRLLKISIVIFFVSPDSWYYYNQFIVGFFKDSIDYLITMILDLSTGDISSSSPEIEIAKSDRETDISNSTRFSYIDLIIKKMLSKGTAKKVFGLFFTEYFGFIYIPAIYALIAGFIVVMLYAARSYLTNLIKLMFVMALGPIFICFTLFSKTQAMFRNWVGFLGSRAFEILIVFTILYNFLTLINKSFTDLLAYRACVESVSLGFFSIKILKSYSGHSFLDWVAGIMITGALIFITKMIIDQARGLADALFKVVIDGGESKKIMGGGSASSVIGGSGLMAGPAGLGAAAASFVGGGLKTAAGYGVKGATALARASGAADAWNKVGKALPFRGIRTRKRDSVVDGAIKTAAGQAGALAGKQRDEFIRGVAIRALQDEMRANPNRAAALGLDMKNIMNRMDKKLVEEPLKQHLKDEAKRMKEKSPDKILLGKEAKQALAKSASDWAAKNLNADPAKVANFLASSSTKDLVKSEAALGSSQAAKAFAGNPELQNKYLEHLKQQEFKRHDKKAQAKWYQKPGIMIARGYHNIKNIAGDAAYNPKAAQKGFIRKSQNEAQGNWANPLSKTSALDMPLTMLGGKTIAGAKNAANWVANKANSSPWFRKKLGLSGRVDRKTDAKAGYLSRREEEQKKTLLGLLNKPLTHNADAKKAEQEARRRDFYAGQLRQGITKDLAKDVAAIRKKDSPEAREALAKKLDSIMKGKGSEFEKTAALSYVHGQLGLDKDKDPQKLALEKMAKDAKELSEKGRADSEAAKQAKKDLDKYDKGLFGTTVGDHSKSLQEIKDALLANKAFEEKKDDKSEIGEKERELAKTLSEAREKMDREIADKIEAEAKARKETEAEMVALAQEGLKTTDEDKKKEIAMGLRAELSGDDNRHVAASKESNDKLDKIASDLNSVLSDPLKTDKEKQEAVAVAKEASGLVATDFKVDFGASISDALLKAPDLGLKASNPLLGVPDPTSGKIVDKAVVNALSMEGNQLSGKRKMENLNKRMKEFELSKATDPAQKAALEREIAEIDNKIQVYERDLEGNQQALTSAMAGK